MMEFLNQVVVAGLSVKDLFGIALIGIYFVVLFRAAKPGSLRITSGGKDALRGSLRITSGGKDALRGSLRIKGDPAGGLRGSLRIRGGGDKKD